MKPRIGISMNYGPGAAGTQQAYLETPYYDYVVRYGGIPCGLVPTGDPEVRAALLAGVDAVLFTGGGDLDPQLWAEPAAPQTHLIDPHRQAVELALYERAQRLGLPIMGICLGVQLINVFHGGSLHQHLPAVAGTVPHRRPDGRAEHQLTVLPGSHLHQCLARQTVCVNSYHHQAINALGTGLLAVARSEDGVVEAIERVAYPFLLGVQWHPERDIDDPVSAVLMAAFLAAAQARAVSCGPVP